MLKKGLALGLILVFFSLPCFAEGESGESITITTYYPSPYGSYNELEVYRSVTYKPVDKDALSDPKEGELVYNSSDSELYLYNGSTWVAQGGGTANAFSLKCAWSTTSGAVGSCVPVACPATYTPSTVGCAATGYGVTCSGNKGSTWYGDGWRCQDGGGGTAYGLMTGYCERVCYK